MSNTFKKKEKLCSKTEIKQLFLHKKAVFSYPIKIFWNKTTYTNKIPVKTVISVSKKRFKLAVDRNFLKRRIREAYRLNKQSFYDNVKAKNIQLSMIIIYHSNTKLPYSEIESSLVTALNKLQDKIAAV